MNSSSIFSARYQVRHETTYSYSETVPVCHNELHLVHRELPRQRLLSNSVRIDPEPEGIAGHLDFFGNRVGMFAI